MGSIRWCRCVVSVSLCTFDWVCMDAFSWLTLSNQCGCACGSHWGLMHQLAIRWVWHGRGFLLTRILTPISLLSSILSSLSSYHTKAVLTWPWQVFFWQKPLHCQLHYIPLSCSFATFIPFQNAPFNSGWSCSSHKLAELQQQCMCFGYGTNF